jgi:hypothetical protein
VATTAFVMVPAVLASEVLSGSGSLSSGLLCLP